MRHLGLISISNATRVAFTADVLKVAADNDLFRVCGSNPVRWRTAAGVRVNTAHVLLAVEGGLLGDFGGAQQLPDGALAQRLDLSEDGLDMYLQWVEAANRG